MLDPFFKYLQDTAQEASSGPAGALSAYYGRVILPALDLPRQGALLPFGGAAQVDRRLGQETDNYIHDFEDSPGFLTNRGELRDPIRYALAKSGALDFAFKTFTDPLTYAGGVKPVQSVINKAILAPALAPKAALDLKIPGFAGTLGRVLTRTGIDPATDAVTKIPTQSFGDYLWGGPSRRGSLHQYGEDIRNITRTLMDKGHDLELDMGDFINARGGNILPAYDPRNAATGFANLRTNLLNKLTNLRGAHPHLASSLDQSLNPYINQMTGLPADQLWQQGHMLSSAVDHITPRITGTTQPHEIPDMLRRRMDALGYLAQGRTGILGDLPASMRIRAETAFEAMVTHGRQLMNDRNVIEGTVQKLWDLENARRGGTLGAYVPITGTRSGPDAARQINQKLQALGLPRISGTTGDPFSAQLAELLRGRVDDAAHNKLTDALGRWGSAGDPLTDNPYGLVMDRTVRDRAQQLGLNQDKAGIFSGINNLTSLWKTINLMSPGYLTNNALSGIAMSGMAGVNPTQVAGNLGRNLWKMIQKEPLTLPQLAEQNRRLGLPLDHVPAGISDASGLLQDASTLRDMSGKGRDVLQSIGAGKLAAVGGVTGAAAGAARAQETGADDTWGQTAGGALTGALTFGTMPLLSRRLYQPLAQGTEHVLRSSALVEGRSRFLKEQLPNLENIISNATGRPLTTSARDRLAATGGLIGEDDLARVLTRAGATPDARTRAINEWRTSLTQANQSGVDLSNHINFDYGNLNNLEEFARQVFPFSTWGTKAIPFFVQHIAEHPVIGSTIARYEDESNRARAEQGLSAKYAGSKEFPAVDDLWSTLTGRPGSHAFFNPLKSLFPAADAARTAAFEPGDHATAYQHVQQLTDLLGLSTHPVLGLAARLANQDPGATSEGFGIRQASPVQALTGIDLNAPGRFLETTARRAMGQEEPADARSQATLRRLDELALRETGQPITSNSQDVAPYIRAKSDRSGPVWERASQEVDRERGARSLVGFTNSAITPTAVLNPEEARISQARAGLLIPGDLSRNIEARATRAPDQPADPQTVEIVTRAISTLAQRNRPDLQGDIPDDVKRKLAHPTWATLQSLRDQIYDAQSQETPELRGYAGSGSAEKQRLQDALQTFMNTPALVVNRPEYARLTPEERAVALDIIKKEPALGRSISSTINRNTPVGSIVKAAKDEQAALLQQNPALAAYFEYRKSTPGGGLADFLDNVYPQQRGPFQ